MILEHQPTWALVLILKPTGYAINSAITGLGKVSFSAYILHFAVLKYNHAFLLGIWPFAKEGVASIAYEISFLLITVVVTRLVAELTYRLVEQPFVHLGKRVISARF